MFQPPPAPNIRAAPHRCPQGGEADTVIFCATASDPSALAANPSFYADMCRSVVAFSRARQRLVVLAGRELLIHTPCDNSHWEGLAVWRRLAALCEAEGRAVGRRVVRGGEAVGQQGGERGQPGAAELHV